MLGPQGLEGDRRLAKQPDYCLPDGSSDYFIRQRGTKPSAGKPASQKPFWTHSPGPGPKKTEGQVYFVQSAGRRRRTGEEFHRSPKNGKKFKILCLKF